MWCSRVVNLSTFFCRATSRTRSIPDDVVSRSCARPPCGPFTFPSATTLPSVRLAHANVPERRVGSTHSLPRRRGSFAGFPRRLPPAFVRIATMVRSDFSPPFIAGFGPLAFPTRTDGAQYHLSATRSPGSRTRSVHACWGLRPRRAESSLAVTRRSVLPSRLVTLSAPEICGFRGSMASLHDPLPTLRPAPRGTTRTARGRCDTLGLHRKGLSPPTPCRSPGALPTRDDSGPPPAPHVVSGLDPGTRC